ncbi:cadherin-like domain-containing protein [Cellulosimicrobium cellulans]|uniref:Ig-like domain-containing protein n=1 Tax=Cellulosimicrobium cellulans TaxID=1710 RepID=UPI001EDC7BB2|nr:Ig-like domain-containing protein [Cellulosimicrobium cellulans]UKJ62278.1 cadherin-like domain-containing protein [Cellulosimicrobium cellulans]
MRSMRRTGRTVAAVGLCAGLAVGLSALPASAAPGTGDGTTTNLLYSVNGGPWSDTVSAERGDTVTARLFYDTTKETTVTGASLTTQIPEGFTYVPGSTRNVLAPGSNVSTGAVSSETKVAAVADSVWSGDTLEVSPSAGFNGESNASQSGVLRNGVKRYLNRVNCAYSRVNAGTTDFFAQTISGTANDAFFGAGTSASNTAATAADCGPGNAFAPSPNNTGVVVLDLLGNRYVNLHHCSFVRSVGGQPDFYSQTVPTVANAIFRAGTNASNAADTAADCGPGNEFAPNPANSGALALDLVGSRYVNLHHCSYVRTAGGTTDFFSQTISGTANDSFYAAGTNASNTADTAADCGPGGTGAAMYAFNPGNSGALALDLLDSARGQGFVEFAFTSDVPEPAQCGETVTEPELVSSRQGVLNGAGTGTPSSSASVTLAEYVDEGEPCPLPVELVDDAASTVVDGPTEIDIAGNDTIPDGSTGFTVDATSAQGGSVVDNGDGTVTYTPAAGFVGTDSFTYRVTGPDGVERSATVTVTVTEDDEPAVPMVAGGFAAAGLLGLAGVGAARLRTRRQD